MTQTTFRQRPRLPRPRVTARTTDALGRGSLLLEAPAGYGKTTVLQQAIDELGFAQAWVRCGSAERHAEQLVASVVAAVEAALPGAADRVAESIASLPHTVDAVAAAAVLVADLDRLLVEPLVVVLDDAELLAGAPEAMDVIAELVRAPTRAVRMAVATRRSLGLPVAKQKLAGTVEGIGAADLTFDVGECGRYLALVTGVEPVDEDVEALFLATEGWPVAVEALAGTVGRRGHATMRSPSDFSRYVHEEILDTLDDDTRRSVLVSSLPRTLTEDVLVALGCAADLPEALVDDGLLLRRTEGPTAGHAYHPLVRDVLLEALAVEVDAEETRRLHDAVASVLAGSGSLTEAVDHWVNAQSWDEVVAVIAREGEAAAPGSWGLLRTWIERLPETFRETPAVALLEGSLEAGRGEYERAIGLLTQGLSRVDATVALPREWRARLVLVDALTMLGRYDEVIESIETIDFASAAAGAPYGAAAVLYGAHCLAAVGRAEESERIAMFGASLPGADATGAMDIVRRAYIDIPAGRIDETLRRAEAAVVGLEPSESTLLHFYTIGVIAFALTEQGHLREAFQWWKRMGDDAAQSLETRVEPIARSWQALILSQTGAPGAAETELARFPQPTQWVGYPHAVATANLAAHRGDYEATVRAARNAIDTVRPGAPIYRIWAAADLVPSLVRVGAATRADDLIRDALELVDSTFPGPTGGHLRARLLVLRAWTASVAGNERAAQADLVHAVSEAGDETTSLFRREWDRVEPLVWAALAIGALDAGHLMPRLVEAFPEGLALVPFCEHPNPVVRRLVLGPALASGHPTASMMLTALTDDPDQEVAATARRLVTGIVTSPPPRVFTVLGGFSFRRGAWRAEERDWGRPAAPRLVRFLLAQGTRPVPEELLFETFWPDLAPSGARRSLQVAASRARTVLDHPSAEASILEVANGAYRLRLEDTDVLDSAEFEAAADAALADPEPNRRLLERARALWGGEPLPEDRYADWAASWRQRLVDRYVEVLLALLRVYEGAEEHAAAISAARDLVDLDPLDETAQRELIAAYARAGRIGRALHQFLECRRLLVNSLGVEPSEATSQLHRRILAGDPV